MAAKKTKKLSDPRVWIKDLDCLLYTYDAADEGGGVADGGCRSIKKKRVM